MRNPTFLLLALLGCAPARAPRPDAGADAYAVWGAAMDTLFLGQMYGSRPLVVDSVAAFAPVDSAAFTHLARAPWPADVAALLGAARQPGPVVPVEAERLARSTRLRLVARPRDRSAAPPAERAWDRGGSAFRLSLSRVVFDETGERALVRVFVSCGGLCGNGGLLLMRRGADGRWRLERTISIAYA
jgi:hypothetical protein